MHTPLSTCVFLLLIYGASWVVARLLIGGVGPVRVQLTAQGAERQATIDGLRGVLALSVMCCHALLTYDLHRNGKWGGPTMNAPLALGQVAVMLFFMITAFLFWGRLLDRGAGMDWRGFFVGRIFRLSPLYFLAVAGVVSIALIRAHGQIVEPPAMLARHIGAWLAYTIHGAPNVNGLRQTDAVVAGVVWPLAYEWLFYFSLPVLGFFFTRALSLPALVAGGALVWVFSRAKPHHMVDLNALIPFVSGILVAHWVRVPRLAAFATRGFFGAVGLVGLALALILFPTAPTALRLAFLTLFFVAVACDNVALRALRGAGARWLGEVSYGIYLFHGMGIWIATRMILPRFTDVNSFGLRRHLAMNLIIAAALIPAVSLFYFAIERPGIGLGRELARRLAFRNHGAKGLTGHPHGGA